MAIARWGRLLRTRVRWFSQVSGAAALTVLVAACGSTVAAQPSPGAADPGGRAQSPFDLPSGTAQDAVPPAEGPTGAGAPVGRSPAAPAGTGAGGGAPSVGPGVRPPGVDAPGVDGPGVTASTITFGLPYATDTAQANAALGAGNVDPGDIRNYYNVLVDEVNRTGGVAGRRLVPSYYEKQVTSADSADAQWNAACQHWVHDVKAFVFLDANAEVARSCAEKNGMLSFSGGSGAVASTWKRYPHYLEPSGIAYDSLGAETVSGLAQTDYFGKAPVVGIVTWDAPNYRTAVADGYVPQLARLGLRPKVAYVQVAETYQGAGAASASVSSAVLKFQQEDVTHVLILDGPAGVAQGTVITLMWIKAAGSQRYYPRYGFNDLNSPQEAIDAKLWRPDDVRGARYVTVINHTDRTDTGVPKNQTRIACLALMRRHGWAATDISVQSAMLRACDNIWFLRAVLGTARITVNRDVFVARAEALGATYRSPVAYRNQLSAGRHDGIAGFRRMRLDDACGCYVYTTGIYPRTY